MSVRASLCPVCSAGLVLAAAIVATVAVLALTVWLVGRAERREHETMAAELRSPPVLGGAPRHDRRQPPPT